MMLSLFGDAVVAALLVATIAYAAVLNRRLGVLRGDRAKLDELVQGLTVAAQRAEAGVAGLREAAGDAGQSLERRIEEAKRLRDDLAYMLERGGGIADRLEGTIRARRTFGDAPAGEPQPERAAAKAGAPRLASVAGEARRAEPDTGAAGDGRRASEPASRAERELLRALGGR
jgi:hypothetical protein